jgi:hypothetical protein
LGRTWLFGGFGLDSLASLIGHIDRDFGVLWQRYVRLDRDDPPCLAAANLIVVGFRGLVVTEAAGGIAVDVNDQNNLELLF